MTREEWLRAAAVMIEHQILMPVGGAIEREIQVSVGFPATGGTRQKNRRIGECWRAAEDEPNHIFIHPQLSDPVQILGVLLHELVHAADNCQSGHKGRFRTLAVAAGLTGKMTSTEIGEDLRPKLEAMAGNLGDFNHRKLSVTLRPKQSTRMLKLECDACGCVIRTTQKWIDTFEYETWACPCGQGEFH